MKKPASKKASNPAASVTAGQQSAEEIAQRRKDRRNRLRELKRYNPIARIIDDLSENIGFEIADVINECMGETFINTGCVPARTRRYENPKHFNFAERRATNEEASQMPFEICFYDFKVDCREDMPSKVADWLESLSAKLANAAATVRAIRDPRSRRTMRTIRGLVSGRIKAKYCGRQRKFVIVDQTGSP